MKRHLLALNRSFSTALLLVVLLCLTVTSGFGQSDYILFDNDQSALSTEGKQKLKKLAESYKANPQQGVNFVISGHTCDNGSDDYNQALSIRRTKTVYKYLVSKGIPKDRIRKSSYGEEKPAVANADEASRARNRRVDITVVQKVVIEENIEDEPVEVEMQEETVEVATAFESLPVDSAPQIINNPIEGCRVFFSGVLLSDESKKDWFSEIFVVDKYSEYVGAGEYADNTLAFPKSVATTFDGIAVGEGTRVIIYEGKDFKGKVLLDVTGPAIIQNKMYQTSKPRINSKKYENEELQRLFPPKTRRWSKTMMHTWSYGSLKIMCE